MRGRASQKSCGVVHAIWILAAMFSLLPFLSGCSPTQGGLFEQGGTTNPALRAHMGGEPDQYFERPNRSGHS